MGNETTISQSLLDKLNDISFNNDRIIKKILIVKHRSIFDQNSSKQTTSFLNRLSRFSSMKLSSNNAQNYSLGISIVQGTDNNVYVKDLVKNGPGEKYGVQIGDQVF